MSTPGSTSTPEPGTGSPPWHRRCVARIAQERPQTHHCPCVGGIAPYTPCRLTCGPRSGGGAMERERPPYLGELPRDRRGNWAIYALAAALLAALLGGWRIYADTVAAWHTRFQSPSRSEPATSHTSRAQEIQRQQTLAQIRAQREAAQRQAAQQHSTNRHGWKCIDGILFRPLPGGGWENVPGERCATSRQ